MDNFIYETILSFKYVGIGILMIFFSGEAVMPFVGFKASQGSLNVVLAALAGAFGSTAGSTGVYLVTRFLNKEKSTRLLAKYGKWLGITAAKIDRAGTLFDAHARRTVFIGRFIPGIRTAVSIPAGYQRMPINEFLFYTFLGSVASAAVLALIGYYLGVGFAKVEGFATIFTYVLATIIVMSLLFIVLKRQRARSDS